MAPPHNEPEKHRKLFVGGIDYSVTEEELKAYYGRFGEVVNCVLMKNTVTSASKGFGFVTFRTSAMVDNAQSHRPHRLNGREVHPKRAVPRELKRTLAARLSVNKIFVGGLKEEVDVADLQAYFSRYGNIVNIDIRREHETGRKRGFGFVEFDDYDPVDKVIPTDKNLWLDGLADKAEEAVRQHNSRELYQIINVLCGRKRTGIQGLKDKKVHRRHIIHGKRADVQKARPRVEMEFAKKSRELSAAFNYHWNHGIYPGEALIDIGRNRGVGLTIFRRVGNA